MEHNYL